LSSAFDFDSADPNKTLNKQDQHQKRRTRVSARHTQFLSGANHC
jgi:hypothetical protein